ncbi:MAG: hypothetical protein ACWGQW_02075 [bacterium]
MARWLNAGGWAGWIYVDDTLNDTYPMGPKPSHWYPVPSIPAQEEVSE